jgi:hypothetical protein
LIYPLENSSEPLSLLSLLGQEKCDRITSQITAYLQVQSRLYRGEEMGGILAAVEAVLVGFGVALPTIDKLLSGIGRYLGQLVSKLWGTNADSELQAGIQAFEEAVKAVDSDALAALQMVESLLPGLNLLPLEQEHPGTAQAVLAKMTVMRNYKAMGKEMPHSVAAHLVQVAVANVRTAPKA